MFNNIMEMILLLTIFISNTNGRLPQESGYDSVVKYKCDFSTCNLHGQCFQNPVNNLVECDCLNQYYIGAFCHNYVDCCELKHRCNNKYTSKCFPYYGNFYCSCAKNFIGRYCDTYMEGAPVAVNSPALWTNLEIRLYRKTIVFLTTGPWMGSQSMLVFIGGIHYMFKELYFTNMGICGDVTMALDFPAGDEILDHTICTKLEVTFRVIGFHYMQMETFTAGIKAIYTFETYVKPDSLECTTTYQFDGGQCTTDTVNSVVSFFQMIYLEFTTTATCKSSLNFSTASFEYKIYSLDAFEQWRGDGINHEKIPVTERSFSLSDADKLSATDYFRHNFGEYVSLMVSGVLYTQVDTLSEQRQQKGYNFCIFRLVSPTLPHVLFFLPGYLYNFPDGQKLQVPFIVRTADYNVPRWNYKHQVQLNSNESRGEGEFGIKVHWKFLEIVDCFEVDPMTQKQGDCGMRDMINQTRRGRTDYINITFRGQVRIKMLVFVERNYSRYKRKADISTTALPGTPAKAKRDPSKYTPEFVTTRTETIFAIAESIKKPYSQPIFIIECLDNCGEGHESMHVLSDRSTTTLFRVRRLDDTIYEKGLIDVRWLLGPLNGRRYSEDLSGKRKGQNEYLYYKLDGFYFPEHDWEILLSLVTYDERQRQETRLKYFTKSYIMTNTSRQPDDCGFRNPLAYTRHKFDLIKHHFLCYNNIDINTPIKVWFFQKVAEFPSIYGNLFYIYA